MNFYNMTFIMLYIFIVTSSILLYYLGRLIYKKFFIKELKQEKYRKYRRKVNYEILRSRKRK